MKRIISILLCLCLIMTLIPAASPSFAEEGDSAFSEQAFEEEISIEEHYEDSTTVYDLENEVDTPILPEEDEPSPVDEEDAAERVVCPSCEEQVEINEADISAGGVVCPLCGEYIPLKEDAPVEFDNSAELAAEYVSDEIIIKFKEPWQVPGKEKQLQKEIDKVAKVGFVEYLGVYVVKVDDLEKNPNAVLNRFKNNNYIEYVEPNYTFRTEIVPNDPGYTIQKAGLTAINMLEGWDIIKGGSASVVAVIDSGVSAHADLPPLLPGYAAVASLSPNNDKLGHGTGVAGTIGAIGNNGQGGAGVNWNASILPVKVDDANGVISVANMARGIIWAADNGAKVFNLSLGTTADSLTLKNAIDYAYNKGCAIFAATGNDGKAGISFPARYPNVMAVGATSNGTARASLSNYGPELGVVAMTSYYTTTTAGGYSNMAGTSFSSPQAAGLASLIWALNPGLTNAQVYDMIIQGATPLDGGFNTQTGYGLINMGRTLEMARASVGGASTAAAAAEAEAKAKAEAEAAAKAAAEAEAKAKAEAEAAAKAAAEAQAKAKAEAEAAAKAAAEAEAKAAAEAAAKAAAQAQAAAEAAAKAEAEAKAAAEAKAKAEAEAKAAAEAAAKPPETQQEVRTPPTITLAGFTALTLEYGAEYAEMGYTAIDCKGVDLTALVKVNNTVKNTTAGLYTITYEVTDSAGLTARATRSVTVNPKPADPPKPAAPKITIIGSNPIILHSTSATPYKEQMARAIDGDGTDISNLVQVAGTVNRTVAGAYTLTYSVTSPKTGLTSATTRTVRIVAPSEKKDPRAKYGFSGQAKQGGKITHTGVVSGAVGFMDLKVINIDKNMSVIVELVDTATKKTILKDTFTAAGANQYRIDKSKYELVVTVDKANGNSKYDIELLMPETETTYFFADEEVPLASFNFAPRIAPVGSNPIILHLESGTPYKEQGARAVDCHGKDISDRVEVIGKPVRDVADTYIITYRVTDSYGQTAYTTREVRILAPGEYDIADAEVPLGAMIVTIKDGQVPLSASPLGPVVIGDCHSVYVRSGPGMRYNIVGALPCGTEVLAIEEKSGWLRVTGDAAEGWIYSAYAR